MDTLIIQDSFAPYYAGKDHESAPEKPKPAKRWLASRGEEAKSEKQTAATDRRAGA